jgi:FlaG/FlaF family flagellin (archaellin)
MIKQSFIHKKHDSAVSAVIAVILMLAIAVAIAATVYVYISNITGATVSNPTLFSMNMMMTDDSFNRVVWVVTGVEGNPIEDIKLEKVLLTATGTGDSTASFHFEDVNGDGYVNPGDTYTATASIDEHYAFLITDPSGAIVYKSTLIHY